MSSFDCLSAKDKNILNPLKIEDSRQLAAGNFNTVTVGAPDNTFLNDKIISKKTYLKEQSLILHENKHMEEFIRLLMKQRNTGVKWTGEEITRLKSHLKHYLCMCPP